MENVDFSHFCFSSIQPFHTRKIKEKILQYLFFYSHPKELFLFFDRLQLQKPPTKLQTCLKVEMQKKRRNIQSLSCIVWLWSLHFFKTANQLIMTFLTKERPHEWVTLLVLLNFSFGIKRRYLLSTSFLLDYLIPN